MTLPPNLTPEDNPQMLEFALDEYDQKGSDFLPESYAIDATGNTVN